VKISYRWFSYRTYGTVMGILSLSFLFGDASSRAFPARLIGKGLGWRASLWLRPRHYFSLFLVNLILLKETPLAIGESEPPANPRAIVVEPDDQPSRHDPWPILQPFFLDSSFWMVCALSFTFTLVRETFNLWTPTYFIQVVGVEDQTS
jgi:OPA family glycerol-3-phosphate transporter-like MFS transporter